MSERLMKSERRDLTALHEHAERLHRELRLGCRGGVPGGGAGAASLSEADLHDLVQETFARAVRQHARVPLDDSRDLGPYLVTIARNLRIDLLRRRRWQFVSLESVEVDALASSGPSGKSIASEGLLGATDVTDEEGESAHHLSVLIDYLSALPPPLRRLYQARFVEGRSQRAAAAHLGLSRRNVRTLERQLLLGGARALNRNSPA